MLALALAVLVLLWGAGGSEAGGAPLIVTSTGDGSDSDLLDGVCEDGTGHCTLRAAIEQADSGDSIDITAGTYTLTLGSELVIDKSLILTGAGSGDTIIQAASAPSVANFRVLTITTRSDVAISGITIRYGDTPNSGGGIFSRGKLILVNRRVSDNQAWGAVASGVTTYLAR